MTACTNKARGAVVAALAGALALGAAPAIAVAATPADGDVSLLAVTAWRDAKIYSASNGQGGSVSQDALKTGVEFEQGSGQYLVPTALTNIEGEEGPVRVNGDWTVTYTVPVSGLTQQGGQYVGFGNGGTYYFDRDAKHVALDLSNAHLSSITINSAVAKAYFTGTLYDGSGKAIKVDKGEYSVNVSDGTNTTPDFQFDIVAPSNTIEGAYAFVGSDSSNKEIVFNNTCLTDGDIHFADKNGNELDVTNWENWRTADGTLFNGATGTTRAGSYFVDITTRDGKKATVAFTVAPLVLSDASVAYADRVSGPHDGQAFLDDLVVNGKDAGDTNLKALLKIDSTDVADYAAKGVHTVVISVDASAVAGYHLEGCVSGTATVKYAVLDADVASGAIIKYGDTVIGHDLDIDLFEGESFDATKVSLVSGGVTYGADDLEVTVDGDPAEQGNHTVTVRVKPRQVNGKWVGGSTTFQLDVNGASIDADERLYFYLNGKLAGNSATVTYDGHDWLEDLEVVVKNAAGEEIDASAYDVTVTKGGKEVESATDAGTYQVKVTGKTFTLSNGDDTLDLTVSPLSVDKVEVVADIKTDTTSYLRYTGEEITPSYTFYDYVDGEYVEVEVPAEAYDVTYAKGGKRDVEVKEVGTYFANFQTAVDVTNYVVNSSCVFEVTKNSVFADVPSDAFYAQSVYDAVEQGYIGGIGGTNLFAPMNQLTRADMACVLYRMAGGSIKASDEDLTNENIATISKFEDVDPHAYYAKAVAWCVEMGIANGYGDTFGSARSISTEEFVTMLARYAAKMGDDTSVDTDAVLAGVADGDKVSGYARDAVAWAVENGYIAKDGNLIAPQESVARWRAVMIAVDYQPEQLDIISDNPNLDNPTSNN
ncbi:S-layer homology domain-containing protein [Thermophilibacter mediterraneus]|uniref:S-layer homology domain-containing protein n=1 Tax=Thermophilibacter mediterraneus TaxID=1871031 RepID=UPI00320B2CD8